MELLRMPEEEVHCHEYEHEGQQHEVDEADQLEPQPQAVNIVKKAFADAEAIVEHAVEDAVRQRPLQRLR